MFSLDTNVSSNMLEHYEIHNTCMYHLIYPPVYRRFSKMNESSFTH